MLRPLPSLRAQIERGQARKVDRLSTVRFGSARYSVPARLVGEQVRVSVTGDHVLIDHHDTRMAEHPLIAPGEVSIVDDQPRPLTLTSGNALRGGARWAAPWNDVTGKWRATSARPTWP